MGILNTTPRTWVSGETVTAAELNTEIRNAITALQSGWTSYTPVLGGLTLGNGTLTAAYQQWGKTISYRVAFTAGTTTTFTGAFTFSLPVSQAAYAGGHAIGSAYLYESSSGSPSRTAGAVCINSSSNVYIVSARDANATVTNAYPWTWASGDQIMFSGTYEAA